MTLLALDAEPVPVTVLTGFLGSGKTTLLARLLRHPAMAETAVIVNELGEVGLDHHLLESSDEDTLLLGNGCLCCGLRGDLVATLQSLLDRRERGEAPAFRRVAIETTGLADPVPILQSFRSDPLRLSLYKLESLVACVDAVSGAATLARHAEAQRQAALADTIILTKNDLADGAPCREAIRRLNPRARLIEATHGDADPDDVLGSRAAMDAVSLGDNGDHSHGHGRIVSVTMRGGPTLAWDHVRQAVAALVERHGDSLLRVKGLLAVEGMEGPVLVDGVQHLFHRPRPLEAWPRGVAAPFLVGIAEDVEPEDLRAWLAAVLAPGKADGKTAA